MRLRELRQHVEQRAKKRWNEVAGTFCFCAYAVRFRPHASVILPQGNPVFVPRVLDVEKGKLCFIIGTVYMDMPLKPNVLEDVARDVSPQVLRDVYLLDRLSSVRYLLLRQERNITLTTIALCSKTNLGGYAL